MELPFQIAAGSVTGQRHLAARRNNQDAFAWWSGRDGLVAVVCDGCSGGAHSEVGAKLGEGKFNIQLVTEPANSGSHR